MPDFWPVVWSSTQSHHHRNQHHVVSMDVSSPGCNRVVEEWAMLFLDEDMVREKEMVVQKRQMCVPLRRVQVHLRLDRPPELRLSSKEWAYQRKRASRNV